MECSIRQSKLIKSRHAPGPNLFSLFLIPVVFFNLIILVYPLVIEGMVLGAPLPVSEFDRWIFDNVLGGFTYDKYVWVLLGFFSISFVGGVSTAWMLLWPIFGKLIQNYEVVIQEKEMGLRAVSDSLFFTVIIFFIFDRAVAFLVQYPKPFPSITFISFISGYLLAGFITGNGVTKFLFYVKVHFKCKRQNLKLLSLYGQINKKGQTKQSRLILWTLASKNMKKAD